MKKILVYFLFALCTFSVSAEDISLNGSWIFAADSLADYHDGISNGCGTNVTVPHTWNVMDGLTDYIGRCWYEKVINLPDSLKGKTVRLHFDAVYHDAIVYVNGKKVGEHLGAGYTPFSFDITNYLNYGNRNSIVVSVDNSFSEINLPYKRHFDWTVDGGIYRNVTLHVSNHLSLRYVHVTPVLQVKESMGQARFDIRLWEEKVKKATFQILCCQKKTGEIVAKIEKQFTAGKDGHFTTMIDFGKVLPWHFDNPNLYTFQVKVLKGKDECDVKKGHFGFRSFEIQGKNIILNGEKVRLPGIEYMAGSNPEFGSAEPAAYLDSISRKLKNLNVTITRFHWQQDEQLLNLMDEYGILVQEEIPWWQQPNKMTEELSKVAKQQIQEMIEAHYNHPSIVMWALSNEVQTNAESLEPLRKLAQTLDSSRLLNVVCNQTDTQLAKTVTLSYDLPEWNEYVGTWNGNDRTALGKKLTDIEGVLKGRPLLISEVGRCEPAFTGGDVRRIDDMIYHLDEYNKRYFVCGYIYFCLNDYRTQMGEEGYGKWRVRRHGVMDMSLNPKPSYFQLQGMASPIEITSVKAEGNSDRDVRIKIHVRNEIPSYSIKGYYLSYTNSKGKEYRIDIPALNPDDDFELLLKDMNCHYNFTIFRPNGFYVTGY